MAIGTFYNAQGDCVGVSLGSYAEEKETRGQRYQHHAIPLFHIPQVLLHGSVNVLIDSTATSFPTHQVY